MKSLVKSNKDHDKQEIFKFPCLRVGVTTKKVVLFTSSTTGFVVHRGTSCLKIGRECINLHITDYRLFDGKLILMN
jgi:hypothetical protein